jgi:hypothetical protein
MSIEDLHNNDQHDIPHADQEEHSMVLRQQAPQVIETASATTSKDNAQSGFTAYLITCVALIVLTAILTGVFSVTSALFSAAARDARHSGDPLLEEYSSLIDSNKALFDGQDTLQG